MINEEKNRVVLMIKRLFHYCGFIIKRIPNADHFFNELVDTDKEVKKYELKKLVLNIRIANNHKLYNNILRKYVDDWNDNFTSAEFIGDGLGVHNLCAYRKVCIDGKYYFEKVYFNDSYDLLKVEWFYDNVHPVLKDCLNIPKLYKAIKGYLITIIYFEFIEFVPLPRDVWYSVSFNISKRMFQLSKEFEELSENAPDFIKDYTLHHCYKVNLETAKKTIKELSDNRVTPKMIEQIINLQPLMFTHGDIHDKNVFKDNYIIDWDSFGFLPQGFETAIIFLNNRERPLTFKGFQDILIEEYKEVVHKDLWEGFELSCWYFYLLFTIKEEGSIANITLQRDVFNRVESLYYKNAQHLN